MNIKELLTKAQQTPMSADELEQQRQSFAYGNSNIENEAITRETVRRQSEKLRESRDE